MTAYGVALLKKFLLEYVYFCEWAIFLHFAETNFFDLLKTSFFWEVLSLATFGKSRLIEISTFSLFFFLNSECMQFGKCKNRCVSG